MATTSPGPKSVSWHTIGHVMNDQLAVLVFARVEAVDLVSATKCGMTPANPVGQITRQAPIVEYVPRLPRPYEIIPSLAGNRDLNIVEDRPESADSLCVEFGRDGGELTRRR